MKTKTVYRVQGSDGRGPWKPGFSKVWIQDREDHNNLKPWFIEFDHESIFCLASSHGIRNIGSGCSDIEQLRRWFTSLEYIRLMLLGYRAVQMQPDVIFAESDTQLVFGKKKKFKDDFEIINLY